MPAGFNLRIYVYLFLLIGTGVLTVSCSGHKVKYEELLGEWHILAAERNGRPTQTLENVVFVFQEDDKLKTNIFGEASTLELEYDFPRILTSSSQLAEIDVIRLTEDTLWLRSRIADFRYDFELLKFD